MSKIMDPEISNNDVTAYCDVCKANTNFLHKSSNGLAFGSFRSQNIKLLASQAESIYGNIEYTLVSCSSCNRGGLLERHNTAANSIFLNFFPSPTGYTELPKKNSA